MLSRPYQRKTQGTLISMNFDHEKSQFRSEFFFNKYAPDAVTEIYVNNRFYYGGKSGGGYLVFLNTIDYKVNHLQNDDII